MARPAASGPDVQRRMQNQRRRDTRPELALRRELHRRGLRFRLQRQLLADVKRTSDIVFGPARVVVEVRGCFWHGCPQHGSSPRSNAEWWLDKITRNRERDLDTEARLRGAGWEVVVVWEHERPDAAAARVEEVVLERRRARSSAT